MEQIDHVEGTDIKTLESEEAQDPERLRAILRGQRETKDSAIFCTNQILSERIWEAAAALRFRDVVMTGVSGIRQKRPYPVLHLDAAGFLSSFLGMLYRQFRTGRVRDPGILFQPEFLLPES